MAGEHKLTDKELMAAMDKISGLGGLAMLYAENGAIIQERIKIIFFRCKPFKANCLHKRNFTNLGFDFSNS